MTLSTAAEPHPVAERIRGPGTKHLLTLDGGGLRGVVTLACLEWIETVLKESNGAGSEFRLRDHFDMIGGTFVGAVIARTLRLDLRSMKPMPPLLEFGRQICRRPRFGMFGTRTMGRRMDEVLRRRFGEITLGSHDITCALVVIAKRLDSNSVWAMHNNPFSRYYNSSTGAAVANKDFLVRRVLRASNAPPTIVTPELIEVAKGHTGFFIDGGVSPFNSPSLLMFLIATTPSCGYA